MQLGGALSFIFIVTFILLQSRFYGNCCSVIDSYFTNIINKDLAKHKFIKDGKSAFDRSIYKKGDGKKTNKAAFFIFIYSLFKVDKKHTLRYFLQ